MIRRIIRFSAEQRWMVLTSAVVLLALSVWTMRTIPLDALPDLSDTQVIVTRAGIAAPTSSRIRSPTPSPRRSLVHRR
jgi:Cu/Ag efflux pump CusA